ncbi:MAG: PilZ domain-containing protein [Candidatus Acidiferrales bacterium]
MSLQISHRWRRFGPIPGFEPVREERYPIQVSIEVCGFNLRGRFFTERAETCNINEGGCKFRLRTQIAPDAIVALRVVAGHKLGGQDTSPMLFQVVRAERDSNQWVVGAIKLQSDELWPTTLADSHEPSRKIS